MTVTLSRTLGPIDRTAVAQLLSRGWDAGEYWL